MKASAIFKYLTCYLSFMVLVLISCSRLDDLPAPSVTNYDLPPEIFQNIFTEDAPKEIRNVDSFLNRIKQNGMEIYEGLNPPEIYALVGNDREGIKFLIASDCIFDGNVPSNADLVYGKYEETIQISMDPSNQNSFLAEVGYTSVGDAGYPQYPSGLDRGSGRGYVSGSGNNFTIFYRAENGTYGNIPYEAIWIISGTVPDTRNVREIANITKCMVMVSKGEDKEDKVANAGSIRIFKDESPEWIQSDVIIDGFLPTEGHYSTVIAISGSGFSSEISENSVMINNMKAEVLEANSNELLVKVPKGAGTGPINVKVLNKSVESNVFTYIPVYTVTTLAGADKAGFSDGIGESAEFSTPYGIAVDSEGSLYVTDPENGRVRKISASGVVSTFDDDVDSPFGITVDQDNDVYIAHGFVIAKKSSNGDYIEVYEVGSPNGIAVDAMKNIYYSDTTDNLIWKVSSDKLPQLVSKFQFAHPSGVAVDPSGNLYVADTKNHLIQKIDLNGEVSPLGGTTQFNIPTGIAVDAEGSVYVADRGNHQIKKISTTGSVSILAGTGQPGFLNGIGSVAVFNTPTDVAIDADGTIFITDFNNHRIRKMVLE